MVLLILIVGCALLFDHTNGFHDTANAIATSVSTTHTITAAIMGAGSTQRFSAVCWGAAGNTAAAWLLTLPAAFMGAITCLLLMPVFHFLACSGGRVRIIRGAPSRALGAGFVFPAGRPYNWRRSRRGRQQGATRPGQPNRRPQKERREHPSPRNRQSVCRHAREDSAFAEPRRHRPAHRLDRLKRS